jgi:hypothetical protein
MEGYCQVELDLYQREQLRLELACENGVPIADDGAGHTVKSDYGVEECPCYGCHRVGVAKRDEVHVLGESVDHREHHRFAVEAWERLDEVHCDVGPDLAPQGVGGGRRGAGTPPCSAGMLCRHAQIR